MIRSRPDRRDLPLLTGRKGAMVEAGAEVQPRGVLLRPGAQLEVQDEEIPCEGVRVRRTPMLARRGDGTCAR